MERTYNAVEFAPLVALRPARRVLRFACAELAEVLCGLGGDVLEELEGDASQRLACYCQHRSVGRDARREGSAVVSERGCVPPRVMSKKTLQIR